MSRYYANRAGIPAKLAEMHRLIQAADKDGMKAMQLREEMDLTRSQCANLLRHLQSSGKVFGSGPKQCAWTFFVEEGWAKANRTRNLTAEEHAALDRMRKANSRAKQRAEQEAKPAPVTIPKQKKRPDPAEPAQITRETKITVCPGFVARSFTPPPEFKGEFMREWGHLRKHGDIRSA